MPSKSRAPCTSASATTAARRSSQVNGSHSSNSSTGSTPIIWFSELAHRPDSDLDALQEVGDHVAIGVGVIDIKVNHIETADEVAARIEKAVKAFGPDRVRWVHPDCGFWMLHRSVADRKMSALVAGRDRFLGR